MVDQKEFLTYHYHLLNGFNLKTINNVCFRKLLLFKSNNLPADHNKIFMLTVKPITAFMLC